MKHNIQRRNLRGGIGIFTDFLHLRFFWLSGLWKKGGPISPPPISKRVKKNESSLFFVFLNAKSLSNLFASLRYFQFLKSTNSLRFANLIFGNNYVRFASLDSQVNVNFLRFASIYKFLNINMFASLRNKFSN